MTIFNGQTNQEFIRYSKLETARIKLENFGGMFESYVGDLVLVEYYLETGESPFVGDDNHAHIEAFKDNLLKELIHLDAQSSVIMN